MLTLLSEPGRGHATWPLYPADSLHHLYLQRLQKITTSCGWMHCQCPLTTADSAETAPGYGRKKCFLNSINIL